MIGGWVLIYERDGVTADRVRQMVRSEGGGACVVDSIELFHELRARMSFDVFVAGVARPSDVDELKLTPDIQPLVLLVPARGRSAHYGVALPDALLVDRRLSDPDALSGLTGGADLPHPSPDAAEPVRQAFQPFGLSERQLEVLQQALLGHSSAEIATQLFISELTVRNHLHAIYERVGVSGRRELMGRFVRGLIGE